MTREFDEMYDKHLIIHKKHPQAYEAAEKDFMLKYNHMKYTSSESYRQSRRKRIRKKRK